MWVSGRSEAAGAWVRDAKQQPHATSTGVGVPAQCYFNALGYGGRRNPWRRTPATHVSVSSTGETPGGGDDPWVGGDAKGVAWCWGVAVPRGGAPHPDGLLRGADVLVLVAGHVQLAQGHLDLQSTGKASWCLNKYVTATDPRRALRIRCLSCDTGH